MAEITARTIKDLQSGGLRTFMVERQADTTGVSGIGVVIEGVVFANGQVVCHWLTPPPQGSIVVWASLVDFLNVHVLPHPENMTRIHWSDGTIWNADDLPGAESQATWS